MKNCIQGPFPENMSSTKFLNQFFTVLSATHKHCLLKDSLDVRIICEDLCKGICHSPIPSCCEIREPLNTRRKNKNNIKNQESLIMQGGKL